jgi:hypothetical protein
MDQIPTKEGQVSFLKDKYMNEPIHFSSRLTPNVVSLLRGVRAYIFSLSLPLSLSLTLTQPP